MTIPTCASLAVLAHAPTIFGQAQNSQYEYVYEDPEQDYPPESNDLILDGWSEIEDDPAFDNEALMERLTEFQDEKHIPKDGQILTARSSLARSGGLFGSYLPVTDVNGMVPLNSGNRTDTVDQEHVSHLMDSRSRCPDLFTDYSEHKTLYSGIVIYGVGMRRYSPLTFDLESGVRYTENSRYVCNGQAGYHGDVCVLECPGGGWTTNNEKWSRFTPARHNMFRCLCSRDEAGAEFCFWSPEEKRWANPRTCVQGAPMSRGVPMGIVTTWERPIKERKKVNGVFRWVSTGESEVHPRNTARWTELLKYRAATSPQKTTFETELLDVDDAYIRQGSFPYDTEVKQYLADDGYYQDVLDRIFMLEEAVSSNELWQQAKAGKTKHLLEIIAFHLVALNDGKKFGWFWPSSYMQYGCYCDEHTKKGPGQGFGQAVDDIDHRCRENALCRQCAEIQFGDQCHAYRGYAFGATLVDGKPEMTCVDQMSDDNPVASCRRALCECDKSMIQSITDTSHMMSFQEKHSSRLGTFDKQQTCGSTSSKSSLSQPSPVGASIEIDLKPCQLSKNGCQRLDMCCGTWPNMKPFWSKSGKRQCCGTDVFEVGSEQCCSDGSVKRLGEC